MSLSIANNIIIRLELIVEDELIIIHVHVHCMCMLCIVYVLKLPPPYRVVAMCLRCQMVLLFLILGPLGAPTLSALALLLVPATGLACPSTCRMAACPAASPSPPQTARNSQRTLKITSNHQTGTCTCTNIHVCASKMCGGH